MSTHSGYTHEQMNSYRNGSREAVNLAFPCEDAELRDAYLSIAKTWAELADKINYYLQHETAREAIRRAGYERCLREHTWQHRFSAAFKAMGLV